MSHPLSRKQLDVLRALEAFSRARGHVPSVRELAAKLRKSPTTVFQHLKALERRGYLEGDGCAHGWKVLKRDGEDVPDGWVRVAIAGSIAAGAPLEAVADGAESCVFPKEMVPDDAFALRVKGDSMIDDHIVDGDLVIVRPQPRVNDGEIAVAVLSDGSATLKRLYREKGRVRLQPANPSMRPIVTDDVRVEGRVVGVWRRCP